MNDKKIEKISRQALGRTLVKPSSKIKMKVEASDTETKGRTITKPKK
jgi:hypothetical protein